MRSLSKYNESTWHSLHYTARSVYYRPAFYRLVRKKGNLRDTDLKLSDLLQSFVNRYKLHCSNELSERCWTLLNNSQTE